MRPEIASVALELAYGTNLIDSEKVKTGKSPDWLNVLSSSRLLIVDTADLNSWCGREVGSLSRFNFNSATVSVDLAALAAAAIRQPVDDSEKPIGIVTPYAAQRRLLKRLVDAAGLAKWVQVGTVYTFQGGKAELIIFDSVLDEPYWSSRLTNPRTLSQVKRDLNVAVSRAREKFVIVGCSEWLSAHAKTTSALGMLWHFTSGLHGKDVIIDERIVYTGSINWSSNRGRLEEIHRIDSPDYAQICLNSIQARHIRSATRRETSSLRTCPRCGSPLQVVNQRDLRECVYSQWTLFFHIEDYGMPETAVNVASRNNIRQLSQTSMTLESVLREAQS